MSTYRGVVVVEFEVEADHIGDAFEQMNEREDNVLEALRNESIEYLFSHVGGNIHEYD